MSRRDRTYLALIIGAYLLLGLLYSAVVPPFEAPDERQHYGYVLHLAREHELPPRGSDTAAEHEASQPPLFYAIAALASRLGGQPSPLDLQPNRFYDNYQASGTVDDNKNAFLHTKREDFPWRGAVLDLHLARLVNLLFGAATIGATYLLTREVLPKRLHLALGAGALVALTPQFLFISAAANNDVAASALSTVVLWLLVGGMRRDFTPGRAALLGGAIGLAALSKVSALALLPLSLLAMGGTVWVRVDELSFPGRVRRLVARSAVMLVTALAIAGWWYARNGILYGDPLGVETHLGTWWRYEQPLSLARLWHQLPGVALTFWAAFGMGNVHLPLGLYVFVGSLAVVAALGLVVWAVRSWRSPGRPGAREWSLTVVASWCVIVSVALLRWMQLVKAALGRLLFPAIGAVAVLTVWGWTQAISSLVEWVVNDATTRSRVLQAVSVGVVLVLFGIAAGAPFLIIQPAYAPPRSLSRAEIAARTRPADTLFGETIRLVGYVPGRRTVHPGQTYSITLCWEGRGRMETDYAYFVHLLGPDNAMAGARNTYPGLGRFPTSEWTAGDAFCDELRIAVDERVPVQTVYDVEIGWYDPEAGERLPAHDAEGNPMELVLLDRVRVVAEVPRDVTVPHRVDADLGGRITLLGYGVSELRIEPSDTLTVTLYWEAQTALDQDYTVFVHLGREGAPPDVQDDRQPRHGSYPTSFWKAGEVVVDSHSLRIPEDLPAGTYQLAVGMYRWETRERLPWLGPGGTARTDSVQLADVVVGSPSP